MRKTFRIRLMLERPEPGDETTSTQESERFHLHGETILQLATLQLHCAL